MSNNVNVMVRLRPLLNFETDPAWLVKGNALAALNNHSRTSIG
jgi:hypothetical protein